MNERIHSYIEIENIKDMLKKSEEKFADRPAFKFKTENPDEFRVITYKEFVKQVNSLGTALINLGLKDKKIAIIGENRYEWAVSYLAVVCGTALVVPLDKSLPENEIRSLIERSEVDAIIYTAKYDEIMKKIKEEKFAKVNTFISMDLKKKENDIFSLYELMDEGEKLLDEGDKSFIDAEIDNEKMSIMLFTSGTTSMSKAVALSHKNICTNLMDIASVIEIHERDTMLSFLPLHHTFESTVGFLYPLYKGTCIAYCEGIRHIADNIREYKVTVMISVPILFENMYKKLIKAVEKKGKLEKLKKGIKISKFFLKFHIDLRKKLFREIHDTLGGKVRLFVNGAAALDKDVERGFNDLGFRTVQGYGLTETSPVLAAGNDKYTRIGSVGKVFPSIELKIENPNEEGIGEIVVKGDSVMIEYYGNKEATENALKDGWFYTGDLGCLDKDGYLFIAGREKDVIVLKNGKNIYPEEIETLISRIEGVKENMVYGLPSETDKDDLTIAVKVVYDKEVLKESLNLEKEDEIYEYIWQEIKKINKNMPPYKYVRNLIITEEELIKTTTQKVKRHQEIAKILQK